MNNKEITRTRQWEEYNTMGSVAMIDVRDQKSKTKMNNGMLLKINELRLENDQYVLKSCLINPKKIVTILSGELTKTGPHIIGAEHRRELRMIVMEENHRIFVDETVEEIFSMIEGKS